MYVGTDTGKFMLVHMMTPDPPRGSVGVRVRVKDVETGWTSGEVGGPGGWTQRVWPEKGTDGFNRRRVLTSTRTRWQVEEVP